jgi:hypothetical protein
VRDAAAADNMVTPPPGTIEFLSARPDRDGRLAAHRMQPPSDTAAQIMANHGYEPGVLAAAPVAAVTDPVVAATPTAETATTTTTAVTPEPTPAPEPATTAPGTGAVAAPQG